MIGKQKRDALHFCSIFEDLSVLHIFKQKLVSLRGYPWSTYAGRGRGSIQKLTDKYRECNGVWVQSLAIFCFFSLWSVQILQTLRVKIYTNRFLSNLRFILPSLVDFQELHHSCIHLEVLTTVYQSNFRLWNSLNFMQLQAMRVLALNFRFILDFDNSRTEVSFRNKLTLYKVSIALQTLLLLHYA